MKEWMSRRSAPSGDQDSTYSTPSSDATRLHLNQSKVARRGLDPEILYNDDDLYDSTERPFEMEIAAVEWRTKSPFNHPLFRYPSIGFRLLTRCTEPR